MREFTVLMALMMSIVAISIDALLPALSQIRQDIALTHPNHAQFVISALFLGMAAGQLVCGPLSDAIGRKKILYGGIGLFLLGSIICFLADNLAMLITGRIIQGLGVAGPYVSVMSIVRDKFVGREMAKVMSLVMLIFIMVPALAPGLGQAVMYFGSWRYIFILYILYAALIAIWVYLRLEETLPPKKRIPLTLTGFLYGFKEVITNPITMNYTVCMGLFFGSFVGYLNSSQQIFQIQFNTGNLFALYFGLLALIFGAASLCNSRLVERLGMEYISLRAVLGIIISSSLFLLLHIAAAPNLWLFLVYAGTLFFCFGLVFGNINAMAMEPMGHVAGIASAIIGAFSSVLSLLLGTWIGQLYDNTLVPMTTGFLLLSSIAYVIMRYTPKLIGTTDIAPAMQNKID